MLEVRAMNMQSPIPAAAIPFAVPASRWDDARAAALAPAELLLYRSNLLGSALLRATGAAINGCTLAVTGTSAAGAGLGIAIEGAAGTCAQMTNYYPADSLQGIAMLALTVPMAGLIGPTVAELNAQGYSWTAAGGMLVQNAVGGYTATCGVPYTVAPVGGVPVVGPAVTTGC